MKKATGVTNLSNLSKLAFAMAPISNAERSRRRNNRLRQAAQRQSSARAAVKRTKTPSPPKRNKTPSPPKRKSVSATARPPTAFRGAIAHSVAPNGHVYYLMPEVPTGRNYNFGRRVPWANVSVSRR